MQTFPSDKASGFFQSTYSESLVFFLSSQFQQNLALNAYCECLHYSMCYIMFFARYCFSRDLRVSRKACKLFINKTLIKGPINFQAYTPIGQSYNTGANVFPCKAQHFVNIFPHEYNLLDGWHFTVSSLLVRDIIINFTEWWKRRTKGCEQLSLDSCCMRKWCHRVSMHAIVSAVGHPGCHSTRVRKQHNSKLTPLYQGMCHWPHGTKNIVFVRMRIYTPWI